MFEYNYDEGAQFFPNSPYPVAPMDTMRFGNAKRFGYYIPYELMDSLSIGDKVWVYDSGITPFLCRVTEVSRNGQTAIYEVVHDDDGNEIKYHE